MAGGTYGKEQQELNRKVEELLRAVDALTAMRTTYGSMSEMLRMWHIGQVEIS